MPPPLTATKFRAPPQVATGAAKKTGAVSKQEKTSSFPAEDPASKRAKDEQCKKAAQKGMPNSRGGGPPLKQRESTRAFTAADTASNKQMFEDTEERFPADENREDLAKQFDEQFARGQDPFVSLAVTPAGAFSNLEKNQAAKEAWDSVGSDSGISFTDLCAHVSGPPSDVRRHPRLRGQVGAKRSRAGAAGKPARRRTPAEWKAAAGRYRERVRKSAELLTNEENIQKFSEDARAEIRLLGAAYAMLWRSLNEERSVFQCAFAAALVDEAKAKEVPGPEKEKPEGAKPPANGTQVQQDVSEPEEGDHDDEEDEETEFLEHILEYGDVDNLISQGSSGGETLSSGGNVPASTTILSGSNPGRPNPPPPPGGPPPPSDAPPPPAVTPSPPPGGPPPPSDAPPPPAMAPPPLPSGPPPPATTAQVRQPEIDSQPPQTTRTKAKTGLLRFLAPVSRKPGKVKFLNSLADRYPNTRFARTGQPATESGAPNEALGVNSSPAYKTPSEHSHDVAYVFAARIARGDMFSELEALLAAKGDPPVNKELGQLYRPLLGLRENAERWKKISDDKNVKEAWRSLAGEHELFAISGLETFGNLLLKQSSALVRSIRNSAHESRFRLACEELLTATKSNLSQIEKFAEILNDKEFLKGCPPRDREFVREMGDLVDGLLDAMVYPTGLMQGAMAFASEASANPAEYSLLVRLEPPDYAPPPLPAPVPSGAPQAGNPFS